MTAQLHCDCKNSLTEHLYVTNNITFEDGYRCVECGDFSPIDDELYDAD